MMAAQKSVGAFGSAVDLAVIGGAGLYNIGKKALNMPGLMGVASQVQNIAEDFKITTTNTEAWGVAASKTAGQIFAGLDMTDKQMGRAKGLVSSVAFSMNTDVGSVAESFKALQQSGVDVTKVGFKSFAEYQKFMAVTGTDSKKFAATIGKLRSQFHMTDSDIKNTITTVVALGKKFNMGAEATQMMSTTVGTLAEEGASLWAELGPKKTAKFLEGTEELAVAFKNAGHSAEEAQGLALGVGRAMIKGRAGVQQLLTGLQTELPEMTASLAENFGSVDDAFQLLQKDPAKFTKMLAVTAKQIRDSSKSPEEAAQKLARFSNQMTTAFGPQFANLLGGSLDDTVKSLNAVDAAMGKLNKDGVISKMASQYEDGRTAQERLMWAQDQFRTKLKKFMHETDADFLKRFNTSADYTYNQLTKIAGDKGILGKATSLFIEFSNHGLGGVASKISTKYGPAMAVLIQQFGPILSQMPAITSAFGALFNPVTLVAGAIAGLYFYFKDASSGGNKFSKTVDGLISRIPGLIDEVMPQIKMVFWGIVDVIKKVAPMVLDAIVGLVVDVYDWLKAQDWGEIGKSILNGIYVAFKFVAPYVLGVFVWIIEEIPAALEFIGTIIYKAFAGIMDAIRDKLMDAFPAAAGAIKAVFAGLKAFIVPIIIVIGAAMVQWAYASAAAWIKNLLIVKEGAAATMTQMVFAWVKGLAVITAEVVVSVAKMVASFLAMLGPVGWLLLAVGAVGLAIYSTRSDSMSTAVDNTTKTARTGFGAMMNGFDKIKAAAEGFVTVQLAVDSALKQVNDIKFNEIEGELGGLTQQADALGKQLDATYARLRESRKGGQTPDDFGKQVEMQKSADAIQKNLDDVTKKIADSTGASATIIRERMSDIEGVFQSGVNVTNGWGADYTKVMQQSISSMIEFEKASKQNGQVDTDGYNKQIKEMKANFEAQRILLDQASAYRLSLSDIETKILPLKEKEKGAAILSYIHDFSKDENKITQGLTGKALEAAQEKLQTIDDEYRQHVSKLVSTFKGSREELDKQIAATGVKYNELHDQTAKFIADNNVAIGAMGSGGATYVNKSLEKISDKATQLGQASANATVDVTKVAIQDLGVSQQDSVDILKKLIGGNKAQIIKNLDDIGAAYGKFLTSTVTNGQKLMNDARTAMTMFMSSQQAFWSNMLVGTINLYIITADSMITAFWKHVSDSALDNARKLAQLLSQLLLGVSNNLSSGLSTVVDEKGNITSSSAQASTASSSTGLAPSFDSLISHIDNPRWASDMKEEMMKEHDEMKQRMDLLIEVTANGGKYKFAQRNGLIDVNQNLNLGQGK